MSDYIDFIDSNGNEWTRTTRFREARETIAAQAAVIEKYRLLIATFFHHYDCNIPHQGMMAEAIDELRMYEPSTDSTQILDEVRRAEREKCAKVCKAFSEDDDAMDRQVKVQCAEAILALA